MFMTVLSGHVAEEEWLLLRHMFEKLCTKPPEGLVQTELVQGIDDRSLWQVINLWTSQETYEAATRAQQTAACEQMFCEAGSVPQSTHFRLVTRYQRV